MAKLTKDEFIAKINEKLGDNPELAVELMEDITDSFQDVDLSGYVEKLVYDELLQKYKDRFMNPEEVPSEIKEEVVDEVKEDSEEDVIDVQDIFVEEEKEEDK